MAFRNGERFIGEDAVSVLSMAPLTTAAQLPRLLGARAADLAAEPLLTVRVRAAKEGAATGVAVELDDAAGGALAGEELYVRGWLFRRTSPSCRYPLLNSVSI